VPPEGTVIPCKVTRYTAEDGRHSNTYAAPGLERGMPAIKLFVKDETELGRATDFLKSYLN